jgi:hypothetical protein
MSVLWVSGWWAKQKATTYAKESEESNIWNSFPLPHKLSSACKAPLHIDASHYLRSRWCLIPSECAHILLCDFRIEDIDIALDTSNKFVMHEDVGNSRFISACGTGKNLCS